MALNRIVPAKRAATERTVPARGFPFKRGVFPGKTVGNPSQLRSVSSAVQGIESCLSQTVRLVAFVPFLDPIIRFLEKIAEGHAKFPYPG